MDLISTSAALFVAAVVLALALPLPSSAKRALLLTANFAFLWFFDPLAPVLFLATALLAFGVAMLAAKGVRGLALGGLCVPLLVPLFLPKLAFFAGAGAGAAGAGVASTGNIVGMRVAYFIGASYYTLRALHFVLDAGRKRALHFGLFDYLVWNSFFPSVVAGPIERADHFAKSYASLGRPTVDDLWQGVVRIFLGLLKKVVIGGLLAQWALPITGFGSGAAIGGGTHMAWWEAWRALYAVALYAWMDFAGYSDLAIGVSRLMGLRLAENFDNPYMRPSIAEFWKGWHLSLSFWIRDYLFLPICGRSASKLRPHAAALGSMLLCGLWHGPNLGWGLWGLAHGAGLSIHQVWTLKLRSHFKLKKKLAQSKAFRVFGILLTFHFVALTWTLVSIDATRLGPTLAYLRVLFGLS